MVAKKPMWTYAYQIFPSQAKERLTAVKILLDEEHADARRGDRKWAGRVILEQQVTHILVVSDSPELEREVNRRLEAALRHLQVGFSVTLPMQVPDDDPSPPQGPPGDGEYPALKN